MLRQTCYFSGRVQGVGFRYTVQNLALQYNVRGYVRNLADGRVELVMEGPDGEMSGLVDDINQKMNGYIKRVDQTTAPATGEFKQFYVKH
ncbi:MAG TPA: acylphosphatase [Tepidisphaeraceae bacterium]|nr:acylphosphatase [Tepidisphaeraceae bacterium]